MTRPLPAFLKFLLVCAVIAAFGYAAWAYIRDNPEMVPWTELDLADPVGPYTAQKIAALAEDNAKCTGLLDNAGVEYIALPPQGEDECRADNLLRPGGGRARYLLCAVQCCTVMSGSNRVGPLGVARRQAGCAGYFGQRRGADTPFRIV